MRFSSLLLCLFLAVHLNAQKLLEKYQPEKKTYDRSIIDSTYGIQIFDKLNPLLGGDSTRNCNGYACNGWVEDFYSTGRLLHKGYYQQGQTRNYKNYYPNGQLERQFKAVDDYKSNLKSFYETGTPKSEVIYDGETPLQWTDYYPNGQVEFIEVYNKGGEYYLSKKSFYESGKPETQMEMVNSKKKIYASKEFHPNGSLKEEGMLFYSPDLLDYQKLGTWKIYKEDGNPKGEQVYVNGRLDSEKNY